MEEGTLNVSNRRLAIVTGATEQGIGEAITSRLLQEGYRVLGSREPSSAHERGQSTGHENLTIIDVDHASRADLNSLVGALPEDARVDALVNAQFYFEMENPDDF